LAKGAVERQTQSELMLSAPPAPPAASRWAGLQRS
jgi:hypothetical protein